MGYTPAHLNVRKVAGGVTVNPGGVTTDDLTIYPNSIDERSKIVLKGDGDLELHLGGALNIYYGTSSYLKLLGTGGDVVLETQVANQNLFLKPDGSGKVKFGTYTAGAALASDGYITILDALGNTRKLMVQA